MTLSCSGLAAFVLRTLWKNSRSTAEKSWLIRLSAAFGLVYALHTALSVAGVYATFTLPPRFPLAALATLILFASLTLRGAGRAVLERIGADRIMLFQVWRILPETLIALLAHASLLPMAMTPAGRNFDIWVPLTAPVMYYLVRSGRVSSRGIIAWNAAGIAVLGFTVFTGLTSAPFPFYRGTESVTTAVIAQFPISFLPLFMVPLAMLSHLAGIVTALNVSRRPEALAQANT